MKISAYHSGHLLRGRVVCLRKQISNGGVGGVGRTQKWEKACPALTVAGVGRQSPRRAKTVHSTPKAQQECADPHSPPSAGLVGGQFPQDLEELGNQGSAGKQGASLWQQTAPT